MLWELAPHALNGMMNGEENLAITTVYCDLAIVTHGNEMYK